LSLQNQTYSISPWDYQIGDENFQKEPWILNKGKQYVTIEKNVQNKGFFIYKKMKKNFFLLTLYKQNLHIKK
tara:strand:+ start:221 stop:436 length:216 start_codon:yes stop_codon:yes gene_type:complete